MKGEVMKYVFLILVVFMFGCENKQEVKKDVVVFEQVGSPEVWPGVNHAFEWERSDSGLVVCVMRSYTLYEGQVLVVYHVIQDHTDKSAVEWAKKNAIEGLERYTSLIKKHIKKLELSNTNELR